jgi:hypothetical protein
VSSVVSVPVEIDPSWNIGDRPHGGHLLEVIVGAALAQGPHPHPMTVSAHFFSPPTAGAATVEVEVLRSGRSTTALRARLVEDGTPRVEVLITAGTLGETEADWSNDADPPVLPPIEDCPTGEDQPSPTGVEIGIRNHLAVHLDPATAMWAVGQPSGRAEIRGYVAWKHGERHDPLSLVVVADALPPTPFDLGLFGWAPTMELTVYIRQLPAPGPLTVRMRSRLLANSWIDEDCDIWDSKGRLVAQARQLAGARVPEGKTPVQAPID